jgi:hypothetical protein
MTKRAKKFSGESGSYVLPSQIRTFVSTLSGDTSPITEKNFSASEIKQMRDAVMRSKERQPTTKKVFKNGKVTEVPRALDPTVDYKDYGEDADRAVKDYSPLPSDAARNTLGRFRYEKTPEGRLVAHDSYDFKDDLVSEGAPRSAEYEKLSKFEKAKKLAKDTVDLPNGLLSLPSRVGSAFIGAKSRPVRVDLGEASFKKGGKVSKLSSRADGIAQRGRTKGRFV